MIRVVSTAVRARSDVGYIEQIGGGCVWWTSPVETRHLQQLYLVGYQ